MIAITAGFTAGLVAGLVFFGGLWMTTTRMVDSRAPGLLVLGSLVARLSFLAAALYVVVQVHDLALLGALGGLVAARVYMTHTIGRNAVAVASPDGGGGSG